MAKKDVKMEEKLENIRKNVRLVHKKPFFYPIIRIFFPKATWDHMIFTFNSTIYSKNKISDDLFIHEDCHVGQQGYLWGSIQWWIKYITNSHFRFQEEAYAYHKQYQYFCTKVKDREEQNSHLYMLARVLSGPEYGNCCTPSEAMQAIRGDFVYEKKRKV